MIAETERKLLARVMRVALAGLEDETVPVATALDDFRAFVGGLNAYLYDVASDAFETGGKERTAA